MNSEAAIKKSVQRCKTFVNALNTELNDLRIIICLRKSEVTVKRSSVCNVTKNWLSMAYTDCHTPMPMMSYICFRSNYDVI